MYKTLLLHPFPLWSISSAVWEVCIISKVRHRIGCPGWDRQSAPVNLLWGLPFSLPRARSFKYPEILLGDVPRSRQPIHLCMGLTFPIMSSHHNHWPKTNSQMCSNHWGAMGKNKTKQTKKKTVGKKARGNKSRNFCACVKSHFTRVFAGGVN